jgi:hypothetical protein
MKSILSRFRVLAFLAFAVVIYSEKASAQSNAISTYATLLSALTNGTTTITNFNPSNSPGSPILISFVALSQATLQITTNVTIDAGTNSVLFMGNGGTRFFTVHPSGTLTLHNLALNNGGSTNGGAIYNQGTLIISNCVLANNSATNGSGANGGNGPNGSQGNGTNGGPGGSVAGGAIYSTGPLFIYSSILTNNTAQAGNGGNGGNGTGQIANGGNAGYGGNSFGGAVYSTGSTNIFYMTEFSGNSCIAGNGGSGGSFATNQLPGSGAGGAAGLGGASAGGAAYIAGPLFMTNCLFFTNTAVGGSTGAAEVDSNGGGAQGSAGGAAAGGGLFITNSTATATIQNSIFFYNACQGGNGGSTALNAAIGGAGGRAQGGGIWSSANSTQISFSTLATNLLFGGTGGTNTGGGFSGTTGAGAGWNIYRSAGSTVLSSSIVSYDTNGTTFPNVSGVTDGGYNVSSDASMTKSTITPTTKLNTNALIDSALTTTTNVVGGNFGAQMLTLAILTNSPAQKFIPGVPGASFPAYDETGAARSTPTSAGAFEFNIISPVPTNTTFPAIANTTPVTNLTGAGGTVYFTNIVHTNGYTGLPFGYQWQFNGSNIFDNNTFSGTQSNILKVRGITVADQGQYQVIISPTLLAGAETSSIVNLILTNPPVIKSQPVGTTRPEGAIVSFTLGVASPLNYYYVWHYNGSNLPPNPEYSGTNSNVLTINPATTNDAGLYSVTVSNHYGTKTSVKVKLTIVADHTPPTIVIQGPANNARTNSLNIHGTATDNAQVTNVLYWITNINAGLSPATNVISGSATLSTNGVTNTSHSSETPWSINAHVMPGTNILVVQAVDYSSNVSTLATRRFFYEVPAQLHLNTFTNGGSGTFVGHAYFKGDIAPSNNAMLNIGEGYSVQAIPTPTSFLALWTNFSGTNTYVTNGNTIRFLMQSNTVINALFVSNIFVGIHGTYNGLFYELPQFLSNSVTSNNVVGTNGMTNVVFTTNAVYTNEVAVQSAGMVAGLSLSKVGTYSGRLLLAGNGYGFGGTFDALGRATNVIKRSDSAGGNVILVLDADTNGNGIVTGTVTNASWATNASLWAHLSVATPGTTNYTLLLAPATNLPATIPGGYGYGLIANHGGTVSITGGLADGTTYSETVPNSISNIVPVYASLYQKTGFLFGWLNLTNLGTNASDELVWIKGTLPNPTALFPAGFTNDVLIIGSLWTNPGAITLDSTSELSVSNSDLDLTFPVAVKNNNVLYNPAASPTNSLTGTINPHTGQLQVTFGDGDGRQTLRGYGAMLQNLGSGAGYFTTKTNAGSMTLEPTNAPVKIPENVSPTSTSSVNTYFYGVVDEMLIVEGASLNADIPDGVPVPFGITPPLGPPSN